MLSLKEISRRIFFAYLKNSVLPMTTEPCEYPVSSLSPNPRSFGFVYLNDTAPPLGSAPISAAETASRLSLREDESYFSRDENSPTARRDCITPPTLSG